MEASDLTLSSGGWWGGALPVQTQLEEPIFSLVEFVKEERISKRKGDVTLTNHTRGLSPRGHGET